MGPENRPVLGGKKILIDGIRMKEETDFQTMGPVCKIQIKMVPIKEDAHGREYPQYGEPEYATLIFQGYETTVDELVTGLRDYAQMIEDKFNEENDSENSKQIVSGEGDRGISRV